MTVAFLFCSALKSVLTFWGFYPRYYRYVLKTFHRKFNICVHELRT